MKLRHLLEVVPVGHMYGLECDVQPIDGFSGLAPEGLKSPVTGLNLNPADAGGMDIVSVTGDTPISTAMKLMHGKGISSLIVNGPSTGIFTDRDAFRRRSLELDSPIWDVATRNIEAAHVELPIGYTLYMMVFHGIRHLPIELDDGVIWRMCSANDLLRFLLRYTSEDKMWEEPIGRIVRREALNELLKYSIEHSATMEQLSEKASRLNAGALLVTDQNKLVGVISEKDNLRRLELGGSPDSAVSGWMTPRSQLAVVTELATACEATELLLTRGIRHLVLALGRGEYRIIGVKRLLGRLAEEVPELANLPLTPSSARGIEKTPGSCA